MKLIKQNETEVQFERSAAGDESGKVAIDLLNPSTQLLINAPLFETAKAANAFWQTWEERDVRSLAMARKAMAEMVIKFAMNPNPLLNNAEPLTQAVKAMLHRGKKAGLAAKAKAWVAGCTAYKWHNSSNSFALKKGHKANTTFNDAQRTVYNINFDEYTVPAKTKAWQLKKALELLLKKAERENVPTDEIKAELELVKNGLPTQTVNVPDTAGATIRNDLRTPEQIARTEADNSKDAA
jgi:hypothetical protein